MSGLLPGLLVSRNSRPDGHRGRCLRRRRSITIGSAAGLAHARAGFQEGDSASSQTAIMDELFTYGTARPPSAEKRFVAVEPFLADLAVPWFNPQQHRLPFPAAFSNAHLHKYSEGSGGITSGQDS